MGDHQRLIQAAVANTALDPVVFRIIAAPRISLVRIDAADIENNHLGIVASFRGPGRYQIVWVDMARLYRLFPGIFADRDIAAYSVFFAGQGYAFR